VEVELLSTHLAGVTHFTANPSGRHEVASGVDRERFFTEYFGKTGE
jgi:hypothetical protein